jgi:hypothetical protein
MTSALLGSSTYGRSGLEGGGDDNALFYSFKKEMEAAGADKAKIDKLRRGQGRLAGITYHYLPSRTALNPPPCPSPPHSVPAFAPLHLEP